MYQKTEIIGNVGTINANEVTDTSTGEVLNVINFTVAVNEKYQDKKTSTWYSCSIWGNHALAMKDYLSVGKQVFIEGKLAPIIYITTEGKPAIDLKMYVNRLILLGTKSDTTTKVFD